MSFLPARGLSLIIAGVVVATVAIVLLGTVHTPPSAIAGPCSDPPELYLPFDDEPLEVQELTILNNDSRFRDYDVESYPEVPPSGKPSPYLKIEIVAEEPDPGNPGIHFTFSPDHAEQAFGTRMTVAVDNTVPFGLYQYDIKITCHPTDPVIALIHVNLHVGECLEPLGGDALPQGPTPAPSPFEDNCAIPTATPTASPTASPTAVPTPTRTRVPGTQVWGDADCSISDTGKEQLAADALAILKEIALAGPTPAVTITLSPTPTPPPGCFSIDQLVKLLHNYGQIAGPQGELRVRWGDNDCSGEIDELDALAAFQSVAGILPEPGVCPLVGDEVMVEVADQ